MTHQEHLEQRDPETWYAINKQIPTIYAIESSYGTLPLLTEPEREKLERCLLEIFKYRELCFNNRGKR